ncbi:hypothetical protein LINGRAHAP2_LOCUS11224 [Linum grandiflorum]
MNLEHEKRSGAA